MVIMYDRDRALREGITGAGSALSSALDTTLQQRALESKNAQIQQIIQEGIQELGQNPTAISQAAFINKLMNAGVTPDQIKLYTDAFKPQIQSQATASLLQGLRGQPIENIEMDKTLSIPGVGDISTEGAVQIAPQQGTFPNLSQDQLIALSASTNPQEKALGDALLKEQEMEMKRTSRQEERAFQRNKPLIEKVDKLRETGFQTKLALTRLEDALASGNIRQFLDWSAGTLGFQPGQTPDAQILESASKELFMSGIEGVTGVRFNQFLEKMLREAGANVGKSSQANQEYLEAAYIIQDVKDKYIEEFDKLEEQFDKKGLELPKNAQKLIQNKLRKYENQKLSEYQKIKEDIRSGKVLNNTGLKLRQAQRIVKDTPPKPGYKWMLDPEGNIKEVPANLVKQAEAAKGRLIYE